MYKLSFLLFFEFFKIGLFTYGGGYASLPFLYHICENYNWYTHHQLTQLIAISGLTPGPVGLNMATFSGFMTLGIKGAIISSIALILPMLIITNRVFNLYKKFSENKALKNVLYILKPTSCALVTSVGIKLFYELVMKESFNFSKFDLYGFIVLAILFIFTFFMKRNPINYIIAASILGFTVFVFLK